MLIQYGCPNSKVPKCLGDFSFSGTEMGLKFAQCEYCCLYASVLPCSSGSWDLASSCFRGQRRGCGGPICLCTCSSAWRCSDLPSPPACSVSWRSCSYPSREFSSPLPNRGCSVSPCSLSLCFACLLLRNPLLSLSLSISFIFGFVPHCLKFQSEILILCLSRRVIL